MFTPKLLINPEESKNWDILILTEVNQIREGCNVVYQSVEVKNKVFFLIKKIMYFYIVYLFTVCIYISGHCIFRSSNVIFPRFRFKKASEKCINMNYNLFPQC